MQSIADLLRDAIDQDNPWTYRIVPNEAADAAEQESDKEVKG